MLPGDALSFELPCDLHAPTAVRGRLAEFHDGSWSLEDGLLVASELVTNAVRHSGCRDDDRLEVNIAWRAGCLRISVHDPGVSGETADPAFDDAAESGGWGLMIIDQLSMRWGAERPDGYRVWAELPATA